MKRLCIFAHWDKDNIIDDYVLFYIKALHNICSCIIFVSDCNLQESAINKIESLVDYVVAENHGEYDFGSYKRGFMLAKNKHIDFEELIFANDSCFGPLYPLEKIFNTMSKIKCDFWGITKNRYGITNYEEHLVWPCISPHIQSYFLVFKKNIFNSPVFYNFITNIKKEKNKNDIIIRYELGLTKTLLASGFKYSTYINKYPFTENCMARCWYEVIDKYKCPFLKTTIIKNKIYLLSPKKNWKALLQDKTTYPISLIEKYSARYPTKNNINTNTNTNINPNIYRKLRGFLLKDSSLEVRFAVIFIEKNIFNLLNKICFNKLKKF